MSRNKKVLVAVPERLLEQVTRLAELRSQMRSELIREALRLHVEALALPLGRPAPPQRGEIVLAH